MKFLKAITSGAMLTILAILSQILFSFVLVYFVEKLIELIPLTLGSVPVSQIIIASLNAIVAFIVIVRITVKDSTPEAKVAWLTLLVFAPISGAMLYIFFSRNTLNKKQMLLYTGIHTRAKKYVTATSDCSDVLGEYTSQSNYLYNVCSAVPHKNSDATFYESGELFFASLTEELEKAEKYIFLEYFIVERGTIWSQIEDILKRKIKEGVIVKMMYDDIGCIPHVGRKFCAEMQRLGIECKRFNKFKPILSSVHNNRDHRKIAVIDGKVGFMGGINLADEYANIKHPFGVWKDSAIKIRGNAVQDLVVMFLTLFEAQEPQYIENYEEFIPEFYEIYEESGIVQPFGDGPLPMYEEHASENAILNMLNSAQRYMYISTPYLIIDQDLTSAFGRAAKRGVDVKIITPAVSDKKIISWINRRNYKKLLKNGVQIFEYEQGFIHAKNYICDDVVGMVGTVNLDYRSLLHHFECGVWMCRTNCLKDIKRDFLSTLETCKPMNKDNIKQPFFVRLASAVGSIFSPLL